MVEPHEAGGRVDAIQDSGCSCDRSPLRPVVASFRGRGITPLQGTKCLGSSLWVVVVIE